MVFSMHFLNFLQLSEIINKNQKKLPHSAGPTFQPEAQHCWPGLQSILAYWRLRPVRRGCAITARSALVDGPA
jgi:hypothetical protein